MEQMILEKEFLLNYLDGYKYSKNNCS